MKRFVLISVLLAVACSGERAAGNAQTGKRLIEKYACLSCHHIPGFEGRPQGSLAPSLERYATRPAISGRVPNNRETMTAFLQDPQALDPANQMPPLGIAEDEARD